MKSDVAIRHQKRKHYTIATCNKKGCVLQNDVQQKKKIEKMCVVQLHLDKFQKQAKQNYIVQEWILELLNYEGELENTLEWW